MNHNQYLEKAKKVIVETTSPDLILEDLYVVWFCKTLGNWKALVSTEFFDGVYWEVTYNGAKQETYVDMYRKQINVMIKDSDL